MFPEQWGTGAGSLSEIKKMAKRNFQYIDHPSDIGLEVEGATLEELFRNAAGAMLSVITGEKGVSGKGDRIRKRIHLRETCTEELLNTFLSEILWLLTQEHFFPLRIKIPEIGETELDAVLSGVLILNGEIEQEIKAVTYHQLAIREKDGKLSTRIIFDV
jgi:SHS2 domain-containing protein